MPFQFQRLAIPEVILIHARHFPDDRGLFLETYKRSTFAANGIDAAFVQDNQSRSLRGVLRGLHYQKAPQAQGKLVRVVRGEVYDVAVDIRRGSPTYAQWVGVPLSEERFEMLYVPPGFAHGYCVVSDVADFLYKVTAEYAPDLETGIAWNDPRIGVVWPVPDPVLSPRDAVLPLLAEAEPGFVYAASGD